VPAQRLDRRFVERIWGRGDLAGAFAPPIGEIWFEGPADAQLLVKYLFAAERLSIQVHPGDGDARALGLARGKDEAWYVLAADPGAAIGLGLTRRVAPGELRAAALDGSIERLLDWRPVAAGDAFYSPGGTIHAIGGGVALVEIQQRLDLTYRLYDYGRPRELHLDEAIAVADAGPWSPRSEPVAAGPGRTVLASGGAFVLERWSADGDGEIEAGGDELLLVPLASGGALDEEPLEAGSVWSAAGRVTLAGPFDLLAAYPGADVDAALVRIGSEGGP
jgi:mannose-6-phosphate isomerase